MHALNQIARGKHLLRLLVAATAIHVSFAD
jgi:hypothetical protein